MDNKFIINQKKVASSSYPPRSSSDEKLYIDYFIWQVVYRLLVIFDIISDGFICSIFVASKLDMQND